MRANIYFSWFFQGVQKKNHTSLSLHGSWRNNQCFPKRGSPVLTCTNAYVRRSGARLKDNKPGTVLCFTAIKTHPIWHALCCLQSPSKTSSYTLNRARRKTQVLRAFRERKSSGAHMRVPFLIHSAILSVNTCQLTDFLFPMAYEKIMAMEFRVNSPININSPWSSRNIRQNPVSLQRPLRCGYERRYRKKSSESVPLKNIFTHVLLNRP